MTQFSTRSVAEPSSSPTREQRGLMQSHRTAQPARARLPTDMVHRWHWWYHDIRILQAWCRYQGVEVGRMLSSIFLTSLHEPAALYTRGARTEEVKAVLMNVPTASYLGRRCGHESISSHYSRRKKIGIRSEDITRTRQGRRTCLELRRGYTTRTSSCGRRLA